MIYRQYVHQCIHNYNVCIQYQVYGVSMMMSVFYMYINSSAIVMFLQFNGYDHVVSLNIYIMCVLVSQTRISSCSGFVIRNMDTVECEQLQV